MPPNSSNRQWQARFISGLSLFDCQIVAMYTGSALCANPSKEATIMATCKFLSLDQFTFIVDPPDSHISTLRVNIYADGRLILNGKLTGELRGKPVQIRFTGDAKHLCIIESDSENAIRFPKNGSKRLPSALEHLKGHKITLPARYNVSYNEEFAFWQGDHCPNPTMHRKEQAGLKRK